MHHETGPPRDLPKVKFRVLIAGRANAGKTTILQRVCGTTESLETYRIVDGERTKIQLSPTSDRGEHEITDELEFSNHDGYVFHDSCGLENGSTKELETLQKFVRERAEKNKLKERLHVIWYCIPMDDRRPSLNIEPLKALQIDKNVPVIAVFTKCDAFRRNMRMDLEDQDELRRNTQMDSEDEDEADDDYLDWLTGEMCQDIFERECLDKIGDTTPTVLLEGMNDPTAHCDELIQTTADALDSSTVSLMLLAVQTKHLELSVQRAVQKSLEVLAVDLVEVPKPSVFGRYMQKIMRSGTKASVPGPSKSWKVEDVVKECLKAFPALWWLSDFSEDLLDEDLDRLRLSRLSITLYDSLVQFSQEHQNYASQDHHSQLILIIALTIILRYSTLTFMNIKISPQDALNRAYQRASLVLPKIVEWVTTSTVQADDIVSFINFVPSDMNIVERALS